jgi:phage terminase large subunit GpA-like protein
VQPTVEMGEAFSKDRLAPMIRDTPVLRACSRRTSRDSSDTILHKAFPGGRVTIAGANAPAGLASRPIRVVLCDEVDRYPASAGKEGDPVGLAEKRTTTFWNRLIALVSTPTIKGESRIEESYEEGDQRRYHVPCPHCDIEPGDQVGAGEVDERRSRDAAYFCESCGCEWSEADRMEAIAMAGGSRTAEFKGHASFHASQLASRRVPLMRIVKEFIEAKKSAGPERLKQWVNTVLAETWERAASAPDPEGLWSGARTTRRLCRRPTARLRPLGSCRRGVGLVTAAVDIQDNRWELEFSGWGAHEERWSLDYIVHFADPTSPAFWEALDDALRRSSVTRPAWSCGRPSACVDSGGHHTQARPRLLPAAVTGVRAIKGVAGPGARSGRRRPPRTRPRTPTPSSSASTTPRAMQRGSC